MINVLIVANTQREAEEHLENYKIYEVIERRLKNRIDTENQSIYAISKQAYFCGVRGVRLDKLINLSDLNLKLSPSGFVYEVQCHCNENYVCINCTTIAEPQMSSPTKHLLFEWNFPNLKKCTCGSEKAGSNLHSDWCDKCI